MSNPLYFGPSAAPMLGWFHAPESPPRDVGIVLCPPVGVEYGCSYHMLRVLAGRLAAAGFPTLRFDYPGTGDSSGSDTDPDQVAGWLQSIGLAGEELKRRSGCRSLSLVGTRLGGLLAFHAAAGRSDVASVVSWWGVGSGRKYVRNLRLYGMAATGSGEVAAGGQVESGGYQLSAETLEDLGRLDPASVSPPTGASLLFIQRDDQPLDEGLVARLTGQGYQAESWRRAGIECIAHTPHESTVPVALQEEIVGWLAARHPGALAGGARIEPEPPDGGVTVLARAGIPFHEDTIRESVVRLGDGLIGVVSETDANGPPTTGIILLPGSSGHRVGTHRISVPMSREWAARGYLTMRFELGGNGDSQAPPDAAENQPFPAHAADNIRAAVQALRARYRLESVVVIGHCAGAWASYRAAVADAGADEYLLLNWTNFYPTAEGNTVRDEVVNYRQAERLKGSVTSWEKWRRLLTGQTSPIAVAGIVVRRAWAVAARSLRPGGGRLDTDPGIGPELAAIVGRSRFTLVFSHALGPSYLRMRSGHLMDRMDQDPNFTMISLTSGDAGFGTEAVRRQLFTTLRDHLARRYPIADRP